MNIETCSFKSNILGSRSDVIFSGIMSEPLPIFGLGQPWLNIHWWYRLWAV